MDNYSLKIFKTNRIRLSEMRDDAYAYVKDVYNTNGKEFTTASPFAQLLDVILNLGRMILFYIENSINELNINTAFQTRSIKGIATLTGHVPSSGTAARGAVMMSYNMDDAYLGRSIYINNYTRIKNTSTGLSYVAVLPSSMLKLTVGVKDNNIELPIIQGTLKYQQATGTGESLQSFNFAMKNEDIIDAFFLNVYVNGTRWENVKSILDMSYNQKACIIKPSLNGGIDVFFGTGNNGAIPIFGASILFEYLASSGLAGNITSTSNDNYWEFESEGTDSDGNYVNLNEIYNLTSVSDIVFGSNGESINMTRQLAPHASRSFALANADSYRTLLSKFNIFSIIDVFSGFNTEEDIKAEDAYATAKANYTTIKESYKAQVNLTGKDSDAAKELRTKMNDAFSELRSAKNVLDDAKMDDNVVYLYLVPDISKRIGAAENYFTCSDRYFVLSEGEKNGILNLIEDSGQRIISVEDRILDPNKVNFGINIFIRIYEKYSSESIKSEIISAVSDYLISFKRRDRMPISEITRVIEKIDGIDSVTAVFDADVNNSRYYGNDNYGIDSYGDIVLTRTVTDRMGNTLEVGDLVPMFRGGFTSINGVDYSTDISGLVGPINITVVGTSKK